ncbi:MAG: glycoside hydrolase family 127 protein [Sedimentisphaerales bacterium]|nr:glycoside hydrolase family 127 protein [Sedimentisphaerales bacterium]
MKRLAIGRGIISLVLIGVLGGYRNAAAAADKVPPAVDLRAQAFGLEDVRLLAGPFREATERDQAYLLRLEPDRLLHRFRKFAGLEPKGDMYGGWEQATISGHSLGHYLSACSLMYASTADPRLKDKVSYIIEELAACQQAHGDGYVAGIPDGRKVFAEIAAGNIRSQGFDLNGLWVPWYTLHKQFAGLIDAYRYCDSAAALTVATRLADWAIKTTSNLNEPQFQRMLACEHGGINESLAELYALTGETRYLELSRRFHHQAVLGPLAEGVDCLPGIHANTQFPKVIGAARRYELTGDQRDRQIAEFFWDRVVHHHSYVTGGNSNHEYFGPPDRLNDRLSASTTESCNTYNMLKLTRHLFAWHAEAAYMDYYERGLFNHILGSQNPADGMMCYFVPLKSGEYKSYSNPFDNFSCCHGSGMENHAKYGDTIYYHDDDSLYVNLFIASEVTWRAKGLSLRQETDFPQGNLVDLRIACPKPTACTLRLRYPGWAGPGVRIWINEESVPIEAKPGSYIPLARNWRSGDRVRMELPLRLRTEAMPDNPKRVALFYGPVVLAGDLGPIEAEAPDALALQPVLVTKGQPIDQWLRPAPSGPPAFETAGVGRPRDVKLIPFYRMHHRRYAVYWDLFSEAEWQGRAEAYQTELRRQERLARRTVDRLRIGEMQPERDHNLEGEHTTSGEYQGRKWRHATDGGWFAFEMKVSDEKPLELLCTYWGGDRRSRRFDILVDGEKIGTQTLEENQPGQFFDVAYPVPATLTQGKQKVTVRFQAHPNCWAGGLYGCRMVFREEPNEN